MSGGIIKTTIREIKGSFGRYMAILAIVMLGVALFSGLKATTPAMIATENDYLAEQNFFDFRLLSTVGFSEDDVVKLTKLDDIADAEGAVSVDALCAFDDGKESVYKIHTIPETISRVVVTAGRMPENTNECVLDSAHYGEAAIGSKITVTDNNTETTLEMFGSRTFTVVGLVRSPYYINFERGTTSIGDGSIAAFLYVPGEVFDCGYLTEIYVTAKQKFDVYTDEYENYIEAIQEKIEEQTGILAFNRYDELIVEGRREIDDAQTELDDKSAEAEEELNDAWRKLLDGEQELLDGEQELADGERELADGRKEITDKEQEILDGEQEILDGGREIQNKELEILDAEDEVSFHEWEVFYNEQELASARDKLESAKETLREKEELLHEQEAPLLKQEKELLQKEEELSKQEKELSAQEAELSAQEAELERQGAELSAQETELERQEAELSAQETELERQEAELSAQEAELDRQEAELSAQEAELDRQETELNSQEAELNSREEELELGHTLGFVSDKEYNERMAEIQAGKAQLQDGRLQLQAGKEQVKAFKAQLQAGKAQVKAFKAQLQEGRVQIQAGRAQLEEGRAKLQTAKAQLQAGKAQLQEGKRQLQEGLGQIRSGLEQLRKGLEQIQSGKKKLKEGKEQIAAAKKEIACNEQTLLDAEKELMAGKGEVSNARTKLEDGKKELTNAKVELEEGRAELEEGRAKLTQARIDLANAQEELEKGRADLEDGRAELADARVEYADAKADFEEEVEDARQKIDDARAELADIEEPDDYVLTRNTNVGYACYESDSNIVAAIANVFPVFFFLVAALICMTTMNRMIEEQRTQIGVLKALGYGNGVIMGKFLFYAGSAAVIGAVLGYVGGTWLFPRVIWMGYSIMYDMGEIQYFFDIRMAALSLAAAILCSVGAAYLSCRYELQSVPARLIRPKAPKGGKRIFLEKVTFIWSRMKFLHKVSIRNIVRYKKRFFMMVLGISGCTALLVTGFGIKDSVTNIADMQYDEIQTYDIGITFKDGVREAGMENPAGRAEGMIAQLAFAYEKSVDLDFGGRTKSVYLEIPENTEEIAMVLNLHTPDGEAIPYPAKGEAVLTAKIAENMGIKAGDRIILRDSDMNSLEVTVCVLSENFVGNYVYINKETYEEQLGAEPEYKSAYAVADEGVDVHEAAAAISDMDNVIAVSVIEDTRERIGTQMESMDYIVALIIVCAGSLAFIVLYNLTNINITERIREIATIKVLGFYARETADYVFRENLALTAIGAVVGLGLGKWLHWFVMYNVNIDMISFKTLITPASYLLSLFCTFAFAMLVNGLMYFKLEKINMAESLKSIE